MNKKYKIILIIIAILVIIFFLNYKLRLFNLNSNIENKMIIEYDRLNYCTIDSDCVIGCEYTLSMCGVLYLYNKNENLFYLNKLSKRYKNVNVMCIRDGCAISKDIKINCIENRCVPDNNYSFMTYK